MAIGVVKVFLTVLAVELLVNNSVGFDNGIPLVEKICNMKVDHPGVAVPPKADFVVELYKDGQKANCYNIDEEYTCKFVFYLFAVAVS